MVLVDIHMSIILVSSLQLQHTPRTYLLSSPPNYHQQHHHHHDYYYLSSPQQLRDYMNLQRENNISISLHSTKRWRDAYNINIAHVIDGRRWHHITALNGDHRAQWRRRRRGRWRRWRLLHLTTDYDDETNIDAMYIYNIFGGERRRRRWLQQQQQQYLDSTRGITLDILLHSVIVIIPHTMHEPNSAVAATVSLHSQ